MKYLLAGGVVALGFASAWSDPVAAQPTGAHSTAFEPVTMVAQPINDDDRFMALRDAALHEDSKAAQLHAAALGKYEIPSYVDYYQLRAKLRTASNAEFLQFLKKYEGSAIADRLRNDWLLILGNRGDWTTFDQQLPLFVLNDDSQVKCYALLSKAVKQQKVAVEARALLTSPKQYGEGCYDLINYIYEHGQFTDADLWAQMRMAGESSALPLAKRLATLLQVPEKRLVEAFDKSKSVLKKAPGADRLSKELFLLALTRAAKVEPEDAVNALQHAGSKLSNSERAQAWAQIALPTSQKLQTEAHSYWKLAEGANLSYEAHQWRVRIALREGDWRLVKAGIQAMPANLRSMPSWSYWYARALQQEGKSEEAQAIFVSLSDQMHFYGQLALEERGQKIGVPSLGKPVAPDEVNAISQNPNLQRALKFYAMNLRFEGTREWNWALRSMNEREILAAAELARQNEMLDRMVNTSDKTRTDIDINQRFPTPYNDSMYKATQAVGIDMAWVYGLIRQESRFATAAKSHVGASGLMQIMPKTAKYVAKKIGLGNYVPHQVNDVETNIKLGTSYMNMVLSDLGGSQALASAAYNAGPGRPRAWRSTLSRTVEGAIFAETIPFTETRDYVKNVLSNATYYAAILEKKPQSLKARLGSVSPKNMTGDEPEYP
ncbi:transglycosylase SLT domain-containing protein [Undibacterium cyanobacteriorum]|uniref:Transglycosylase SLT domain-containing protein n=1 Tax=Undibacterium cyanobacteriorum TaxID=3073561 RepID=A0ABY9RMD8_9BURK|nr:transglycosylase SLT domain-containing protein [Undibacterium sp. 20NA77.5]WMW81445.1 transglycosylase SLT domain-containing protein [Undibacterium sp. 20NA77.5]